VHQQHRTTYRLSYDGQADGAAARLAALPTAALGAVQHLVEQPGRRTRCWEANSVALGRAAAVIDSVAASDVDLAAAGIAVLLGLLPDRGRSVPEAEAFNREMDRHIAAQRDFALLHRLKMAGGEPMVGDNAVLDLSPSLHHRVALFAGRGRLPDDGAGGLAAADWLALLLGVGVLPDSWDVRADAIGTTQATDSFARLAGLFHQSAETMPRHADYIARHCPIG
jgi:tryptophan halogenase